MSSQAFWGEYDLIVLPKPTVLIKFNKTRNIFLFIFVHIFPKRDYKMIAILIFVVHKTTWCVLVNLLKKDFWRPGMAFKISKESNFPCNSRWLWIMKAVFGPIAGIFCNICRFAVLTMVKIFALCFSWSNTCQFDLTWKKI